MSLTLPVAALVALLSPLAAAEPSGCTDLTREVTESVAASPDKVVKLTAEFCAKNPACACEIVSAALVASKADASLRAEIISAALQAAPDQLEAITACTAVEEPSGKAPVGKEPAGKEPAGKEPAGKEPAGKVGLPAPEPESDSGLDTIDFGLFRAGIGGVYIGSPSSGTGRPVIETVPEETTTPQTPRRVIVRIPGTVSPIASSGTGDSASGATLTLNDSASVGITLSGAGLTGVRNLANSGGIISPGSSPVTISSSSGAGSTLSGTGALNGNSSVITGGVISQGNSPGTLNTGNLTLNNGSVLEIEPGNQTGNFDQINTTGTLQFNGSGTLQINDPGSLPGNVNTWQLNSLPPIPPVTP